MEAVAELVELKFGDIVSPKECSERLKFTHSKFPKWGRPWTPAGVGKYIATFTTVDTFGTITGIDETCEKILGKVDHGDGDFVIACANCCL